MIGGHLYRCAQCLLKFRYPIQSPATYRALYDNAETTTWPVDTVRPDWDQIIAQINKLVPAGGRVLDFGCYSGGLLARLDERYQRFGVEVNQNAAQIAEQTTGAHIWTTIEDIPADLRFDVVVMSDVAEHVANPSALFQLLSPRIVDRGLIIVTTGDADASLWNRFGANWWYCFYPEHVAFVSLAWAQRTLCVQGWSIIRSQKFRHGNLGFPRLISDSMLACLYGIAPRVYLYMFKFLKRSLGNGSVTSVPGCGISSDHILLALRRDRSL